MSFRVFQYAFICLTLVFTQIKANPPLLTDNSVNFGAGSVMPYHMEGKWKVFNITAEPVKQTIYDHSINTLTEYEKITNRYYGKVMKLPNTKEILEGWGYNGRIPGPAIVINEGDFVRFNFLNKLPEPTTVHWHGLVVPNDEDGSGGTDDPVIYPGKRTVYQFQVNQVGTFMYHSGFNDTKQVQKGLTGFFIALPKKENAIQRKDYAIMLQIFTMPAGGGKPTIFSMNPDWFTYNGVVAPNAPVLLADEGDIVRIRFGNLSTMSHPIHLHGYTFNIVGTDGGPIQKSAQWPAATVSISPGQTRDIEFVANNPGLWRVHCHILLHVVNENPYWAKQKELGILPVGGMYTYLYVKPKKKAITHHNKGT